jgi:uncharacterized protein YjiS (DUF1127 family)
MWRQVDFDRTLRDFHTLSIAQQHAFVHQAIRAAQAERAAAIGRYLRAFARWSWRTMNHIGVAVSRLMISGWRRYQRGRQRRQAAERLRGLDDRMLKDIGLNRGDIDFVLSGADDPTRLPRPASRGRNPLWTVQTLRPVPRLRARPPAQRAERPLVARKACAG